MGLSFLNLDGVEWRILRESIMSNAKPELSSILEQAGNKMEK
jgi:hypothetical protein